MENAEHLNHFLSKIDDQRASPASRETGTAATHWNKQDEAHHTPGPWDLHHAYSNAEPLNVPATEGHASFVALSRWVSKGDKLIAEVGMMTDGDGLGWPRVNNPDECIANARLIAASPELLAALQWCSDHEGECLGDWPTELAVARAAIAKALGRTD